MMVGAAETVGNNEMKEKATTAIAVRESDAPPLSIVVAVVTSITNRLRRPGPLGPEVGLFLSGIINFLKEKFQSGQMLHKEHQHQEGIPFEQTRFHTLC